MSKHACSFAGLRGLLFGSLALVALGACGGSEAPPDPVHVMTESGNLHIEVAPRAVLGVGTNDIDLHVMDGAGGHVEWLVIAIEPWMPAHGHGATMETTVHEMMEGHYHAMAYFQMAGSWELRMTITDADGGIESAVATVSVE